MCMEGIEQNPVVYELMSEMAFRKQEVQVEVNIQHVLLLRFLFVFLELHSDVVSIASGQ